MATGRRLFLFAGPRCWCLCGAGMRVRRMPEPCPSSSSERLPVEERLRFNCRCSRPPRVLGPARGPPPRAPAGRPTAPRRGRSLPLGSEVGGRTPGAPSAAPGLAAPFLARSSRFFFSSCLRNCSESGLVPALLARIASGGKRISGFCGAGSLGLKREGDFDGVGIGAKWMAGADFSAGFFSPGFFLAGLALLASPAQQPV